MITWPPSRPGDALRCHPRRIWRSRGLLGATKPPDIRPANAEPQFSAKPGRGIRQRRVVAQWRPPGVIGIPPADIWLGQARPAAATRSELWTGRGQLQGWPQSSWTSGLAASRQLPIVLIVPEGPPPTLRLHQGAEERFLRGAFMSGASRRPRLADRSRPIGNRSGPPEHPGPIRRPEPDRPQCFRQARLARWHPVNPLQAQFARRPERCQQARQRYRLRMIRTRRVLIRGLQPPAWQHSPPPRSARSRWRRWGSSRTFSH